MCPHADCFLSLSLSLFLSLYLYMCTPCTISIIIIIIIVTGGTLLKCIVIYVSLRKSKKSASDDNIGLSSGQNADQ